MKAHRRIEAYIHIFLEDLDFDKAWGRLGKGHTGKKLFGGKAEEGLSDED
jgi:hypothetical protein